MNNNNNSNEIVRSLYNYFIIHKTEKERNGYLKSLNNEVVISIINRYIENFVDEKFDSKEINGDYSFYSMSEFSHESSYLKTMMNNYYLQNLLEVKLFFQRNYYLTIIQEGDTTEIYQRLIKFNNPWFKSLISLKNKSDEEIEIVFLDSLITELRNNSETLDDDILKKIDKLITLRGDLVIEIVKKQIVN
jgi:hypothetical protein